MAFQIGINSGYGTQSNYGSGNSCCCNTGGQNGGGFNLGNCCGNQGNQNYGIRGGNCGCC